MNPNPPTIGDPQAAPLVRRLVEQHGAEWVGRDDAFAEGPGDRVLFFSGDAVRFPESLDVAVVLPELQAALRPGPGSGFHIGVVLRRDEDVLARRWAVQRWPSLVFLRGGEYVAGIAGMHDWADYLHLVRQALAAAPSRVPGIGIPLVAAGGESHCH